MKLLGLLLFLLLLMPAGAQRSENRLPNGKSRDLAIMKLDHAKSKEDIAEILELATALQEDLDESQEYVVDLNSLRRAERIEKLARNVKNRMKRLF